MRASTLKPCPFCGSEPMLGEVRPATRKSPPLFGITCIHCGAEMTDEFVPELIQRWNARAVATASIDKEVMAGTVQEVMERIPNALRILEDSQMATAKERRELATNLKSLSEVVPRGDNDTTGFIEALEAKMAELGIGKIASISGRYYAMDRDNRWDRVQKAYDVLTKGEGETAESAVAAMEASYAKDVTDEFFVPTAITENGKPVATIKDKDTVIFFNFRPDRAREITRTFCADEFDGFDRGARKNVKYICFTEYDVTIPNKEVAFKKVELKNTFGEYLAAHGMTQARIAETEKYAHVTFFFNGGVEEPNVGEDRILVKSPKVATYDLQPEMSAPEVCEKLCTAIRSEKYDVIVINFANPDMVGHTGIIPAAIKAIETVDSCVGKAVEALKEVDGQMFICADHGNAEQMVDYETGAPFTAHTTNPVPFILVNADPSYTLRENGCLADIIPTLIELMGMEQPAEMTGKSLLIKK